MYDFFDSVFFDDGVFFHTVFNVSFYLRVILDFFGVLAALFDNLRNFAEIFIKLHGSHNRNAAAEFFIFVLGLTEPVESVVPVAVKRAKTTGFFVDCGNEKIGNRNKVIQNRISAV